MPENYSEQYIEQVFYLWHDGGRKISQRFANSLPEDENGNRPTFKTIEKWRDTYGWVDRAEDLNAKISMSLEKVAIEKRTKMYLEHEEVGTALLTKGREFLESHPIEEMADALKAITLGWELRKNSIGQAEIGQKLLNMSDEQLIKELNKMLLPKNENEFIEGEEIKDSE